MIMNNEYVKIWKELAVVYLRTKSYSSLWKQII